MYNDPTDVNYVLVPNLKIISKFYNIPTKFKTRKKFFDSLTTEQQADFDEREKRGFFKGIK